MFSVNEKQHVYLILYVTGISWLKRLSLYFNFFFLNEEGTKYITHENCSLLGEKKEKEKKNKKKDRK